MIKITSSLILIIALSFFKNIHASNLNFGLMCGVNTALNSYSLNGAIKSFDAKLGYNANIFGRAKIGSFFIQPEFGYTFNRVGFIVQDGSQTNDLTFNLGKLYGSTLFGWKFGKIRFSAGPLLYADANETFNVIATSSASLKSAVTNPALQWGAQGGIGLDISDRWHIDGRLQKIFSEAQYESQVGSSTSNIQGSIGSISLSLGFSLFKL